MNFFKTKPRTPSELVRGLRDAIFKLDGGQPGGDTRRRVQSFLSPTIHVAYLSHQATEDILKSLTSIKAILLGDGGARSSSSHDPFHIFQHLLSVARKELVYCDI
jgi:calcium binding protein 39